MHASMKRRVLNTRTVRPAHGSALDVIKALGKRASVLLLVVTLVGAGQYLLMNAPLFEAHGDGVTAAVTDQAAMLKKAADVGPVAPTAAAPTVPAPPTVAPDTLKMISIVDKPSPTKQQPPTQPPRPPTAAPTVPRRAPTPARISPDEEAALEAAAEESMRQPVARAPAATPARKTTTAARRPAAPPTQSPYEVAADADVAQDAPADETAGEPQPDLYNTDAGAADDVGADDAGADDGLGMSGDDGQGVTGLDEQVAGADAFAADEEAIPDEAVVDEQEEEAEEEEEVPTTPVPTQRSSTRRGSSVVTAAPTTTRRTATAPSAAPPAATAKPRSPAAERLKPGKVSKGSNNDVVSADVAAAFVGRPTTPIKREVINPSAFKGACDTGVEFDVPTFAKAQLELTFAWITKDALPVNYNVYTHDPRKDIISRSLLQNRGNSVKNFAHFKWLYELIRSPGGAYRPPSSPLVAIVGAKFGLLPLFLAALRVRTYAFELLPRNTVMMRCSLNSNAGLAEHLHMYEYAILDKTRTSVCLEATTDQTSNVKMYRDESCPERATLFKSMPTISMDEFWRGELDRDRLFLLFIDLNGIEHMVFAGASEMLKTRPPLFIITQFDPPTIRKYRSDPVKFVDLVNKLGYGIKRLGDNKKVTRELVMSGEMTALNYLLLTHRATMDELLKGGAFA